MKLFAFATLGSTLFACNVVPTVDVMPAYGSYSIDGKVGAASGGASAIEQSFADIGIDGSEEGFAGRATATWLNFTLSVSGLQADYSGRGTTSAPISFDDDTINAGTGVDSSLDLTYYDATLTFDVFPGDTVDIGLGLGLAALDFDLSLADTGGAARVTANETVPLPELALRAAVDLGRIGLFANVGWISGQYDDFDGQLLDVDVHGRVRILGGGNRFTGHAALGYRYLETDFEYDDGDDQVKADLQIDGPYIGLNFSF